MTPGAAGGEQTELVEGSRSPLCGANERETEREKR